MNPFTQEHFDKFNNILSENAEGYVNSSTGNGRVYFYSDQYQANRMAKRVNTAIKNNQIVVDDDRELRAIASQRRDEDGFQVTLTTVNRKIQSDEIEEVFKNILD